MRERIEQGGAILLAHGRQEFWKEFSVAPHLLFSIHSEMVYKKFTQERLSNTGLPSLYGNICIGWIVEVSILGGIFMVGVLN